MTKSPVEKLSVEFGKYIEMEQKYKEIETSIAQRVVLTVSISTILPFMLAGYFYSELRGVGIFFVISLFVLLVSYGFYYHKTAILNVEKKEESRKKILSGLSLIVGTKVEEGDLLQKELEKERDRIINTLKDEKYKTFFDDLYNFVEAKDFNDDRALLKKIEKVATLYDRKFYSVLFHELKANVCIWDRLFKEDVNKTKFA